MTSSELVYVVPASAVLEAAGPWRGVRPVGTDELDRLASAGSYRPRDEMERDAAFKQVIPYLVLRDGASYFLMRRTRAGGDERLHERWSIGVGGHLNEGDGGLEGGLRREWTEEIDAGFEPEFRLVGLLNDDQSEVGRVHVGVVYLAETGGRPVAVREIEKLSGRMATREETAAVVDRMETWSALVFEHLERRERESAG